MSFRGGSSRGGGRGGGEGRGGFGGDRGGFGGRGGGRGGGFGDRGGFGGGRGRGEGRGSFGGDRGGFGGRGGDRGGFGGRGGDRGGFGGREGGDRGGFRGGGGGFEHRGGGGFRGGRGDGPSSFRGGGGRGGGFSRGSGGSFHSSGGNSSSGDRSSSSPQDICIFLVNAGLYLGHDGLVDAYDRGMSTGVKNESVVFARPDIVHQCLLGIFDSEMGAAGRVRVFIYTTRGKTIEVSPHMRPPRTYDRFKGLMATVLRDGKVLPNADANPGNTGYTSTGGAPLLQILQGSIAPIIPEGADVIGITNAKYANIATPLAVAEYCKKNPVSQQLRGGRKGAMGFFCIDCRDEADPSEEPSITKLVSLSPYPQAAHIQAIRLCEGFQFLNPEKFLDERKQQYYENKSKEYQQKQEQQQQQQQQSPRESGVRRQREE